MNTLCKHTVIVAALLASISTVQAREEYEGVTSVAVTPFYGTMSAKVDEPEQVKALVQEINAQRRKAWQSHRGKPSACAVRLTFSGKSGRIARLVLDGDELLELGLNETSGYKREISTFDVPAARRLASRVKRPSDCRR